MLLLFFRLEEHSLSSHSLHKLARIVARVLAHRPLYVPPYIFDKGRKQAPSYHESWLTRRGSTSHPRPNRRGYCTLQYIQLSEVHASWSSSRKSAGRFKRVGLDGRRFAGRQDAIDGPRSGQISGTETVAKRWNDAG